MPETSKTTVRPIDTDRELAISPEKVCFIIVKAREFDAKDEVTEPDPDRIRPTTRTPRCWKTTRTIRSSRS
jgi:hypothetical protein